MADIITLRTFAPQDLPALVDFWNREFAERRNFHPITAADYSTRVLAHPAFDANGLLLAWKQAADCAAPAALVGMAHAFRPAPQAGLAAGWGEGHTLALLYVEPGTRGQSVGTRLIQAAENWLYYCPVLLGWPGTPAYGTVEGYHASFFGSSEHMGMSVHDASLTRFLSRRGYRVVGAGDVSMLLDLAAEAQRWAAPPVAPPSLAAHGLRLVEFDQSMPFVWREPDDRPHFPLIADNHGDPYGALGLVDGDARLLAHAVWYPLIDGRAAFSNFRVSPALRGRGLGSYLLDSVLHRLAVLSPPLGGYGNVELMTHLLRNAPAVRLYEARGFAPVEAWVQMEKT